jgi:hypothetical protein
MGRKNQEKSAIPGIFLIIFIYIWVIVILRVVFGDKIRIGQLVGFINFR